MKIDFKALLLKYIKHVRQSEGIDFIDRINQSSDVKFAQQEVDFLKSIEQNLWENVTVSIGGRVIEGITSVNYNTLVDIADLESQLNFALMNEDYELCAILKDKITKLKAE